MGHMYIIMGQNEVSQNIKHTKYFILEFAIGNHLTVYGV